MHKFCACFLNAQFSPEEEMARPGTQFTMEKEAHGGHDRLEDWIQDQQVMTALRNEIDAIGNIG